MIIEIGKKLLNKKCFSKLRYMLTFSAEISNDFITKTARSEIGAGSKILDAGAGHNRFKKYFPDCLYKTQDFKQYGEIDYVCDIINIPVEASSFDVIICTEVFEHIPRPDLALKEFFRILKPNGKLYITAPLNSVIHQAPYHYYGGFSKFWYSRYLNKYGFKEIDIKKKKGFFAFYSYETFRALLFLIKSKKWRHKILIPLTVPLIFILPPLLFGLDKHNLDTYKLDTECTAGYIVKAIKK
ncbi:class I SAM-dependent methyltransferase [Patescibacteria group bacterium]|nr:class I SAM-dependent methyltransferase [Patescibacteria group bacterium]